jgi:hypothetical protein
VNGLKEKLTYLEDEYEKGLMEKLENHKTSFAQSQAAQQMAPQVVYVQQQMMT